MNQPMTEREIRAQQVRLRCVEIADKHHGGSPEETIKAAQVLADFVLGEAESAAEESRKDQEKPGQEDRLSEFLDAVFGKPGIKVKVHRI